MLLARTRDASFFAGLLLLMLSLNRHASTSSLILAPFRHICAAAARYPASIIRCPQRAAYASLSSSASSSPSLKLRSPNVYQKKQMLSVRFAARLPRTGA